MANTIAQAATSSSTKGPKTMHIKDILAEAQRSGKPRFSFEFFPPKTEQVCTVPLKISTIRMLTSIRASFISMSVNLSALHSFCSFVCHDSSAKARLGIDKMHSLGPAFVDVTWGAGGSNSKLTCEIISKAQGTFGLETCMHLTCTDMGKEKVDEALRKAYKAGCTNILALRGDPPRDKEKWQAVEGGFHHAKDLVKYIKENYKDHFDIGVAGYPEGCDDQKDQNILMKHLKEKVDAGGTFIITQMFYDVDIFLSWVEKCRAYGINVPIVPGIMPIQTYAAFLRRANFSKCHIPKSWMDALEPVKMDDAVVREVGKDLVMKMCHQIIGAGIMQLHLYAVT